MKRMHFRGMQLLMGCRHLFLDGDQSPSRGGKPGFPAVQPAFSHPAEPCPGALPGEISECNLTPPGRHTSSARGSANNCIYFRMTPANDDVQQAKLASKGS